MTNETIMMAVTETLTIPVNTLTRLVQAIGGLLAIYMIFNVANTIINWKRNKEIKEMRKDITYMKNILTKKYKNK